MGVKENSATKNDGHARLEYITLVSQMLPRTPIQQMQAHVHYKYTRYGIFPGVRHKHAIRLCTTQLADTY